MLRLGPITKRGNKHVRWVTTVLWRMLTNKEKYRLDGVPGCYLKRKKAA